MKYLTIFSGVSFIFYGILALVSKKMILEYNRWGYAELRFLIGALQLLGGLGLLLGLYFNLLIPLSSASLMLLMLAAIGVRFNIKEESIKMLQLGLQYLLPKLKHTSGERDKTDYPLFMTPGDHITIDIHSRNEDTGEFEVERSELKRRGLYNHNTTSNRVG